MTKVILKINFARMMILKARASGGGIQKLKLVPMVNDNDYQSVDSDIWKLVRNQPLVKRFIKEGQIVIVNQSDLEDGDNVVDAHTETKHLTADSLVMGKDAVEKEVLEAFKAGNFDAMIKKHPVIAQAIQDRIDAAVTAATEDNKEDEATLADNVDALIESLGNDVESDVLKNSLRDFALNKYELKLHHNAGVDTMLTAIKEKEAELADVD